MIATANLSPACNKLISALDEVVSDNADSQRICNGVKAALERQLREGNDFLPAEALQTNSDGYARHCLFRDPQKRFSIVIMVWDVGQKTPVHDHAGHWCVECVYDGKIRVVSYDLREQTSGGLARLTAAKAIMAGVGEAGALIPPLEYHTIENPTDQPAVTIHVYEGEITWCNIFTPQDHNSDDDWYQRERKELTYCTI